MYFLIDESRKILWGWSAKCGCSYIKKLYFYLSQGILTDKVHKQETYGKLTREHEDNINNYTVIIIIRNPYLRLVSGFINKFNDPYWIDNIISSKKFQSEWLHDRSLSFKNFVSSLVSNNSYYNWLIMHHFAPQVSSKEYYNPIVLKAKSVRVFDLEHIDYKYLERLYQKSLPLKLIEKRDNSTQYLSQSNQFGVCDIPINELSSPYPKIESFYNSDLKQIVKNFYQEDFDFASKFGFNYE